MSGRILLLLPPPPSAAAAAAVDRRHSHLDGVLAVSFAALFSLSLAYLLLSSLHHCRRRRRGTSSDRIPDKTQAPDAACSAQLQAIPITTVRKNVAAAAATTHGDTQEEESTCAVCLGQYNEGEEIRTMPRCGHVFHRECIDRWLIRRSSFCPVCRGRVIRRSAEPTITSCWVETGRVGPVPLPSASAVSTPIASVL
ncbi:RING-H2 finger protein ATL66-like isoform X1 [Ananas comosus]|uniref:RING-H2 finger protein ATL66-like isoform X1 n=1 Tax=Ananas comosus TaxID=4615 RepID=A0A6P5H808_ANACO|nr:RING-H2 finger protein ATL66-like isoform X1 [Ananas comosus]